jgi:hypothetical protein
MSRFSLHPEHHPHLTSALYLSRLDHESLYANTELRQAIAGSVARLDGPGALGVRYAEALRPARAKGGSTCEARGRWAVRMPEDLTRDRSRDTDRAVGGGLRAAPLRGAS